VGGGCGGEEERGGMGRPSSVSIRKPNQCVRPLSARFSALPERFVMLTFTMRGS
jgi:hypothetical protein